ncbi:hypothetical protein LCGC14_0977310 [marine sediment metagenome]|uniref:Intracellular proteinase inhibitor BsuPI domain-containing protein n=1 Tax=marine sediment metagenome TaxID=412755 RepID=A0A0F9N9W8_9ZZZZ
MIQLGVTSLSNKSLSISRVPQGQKVLVHIWGQNNTTLGQRLGISWIVRDPDGLMGEQYSDWSRNINPGNDHEFIGGRFEFFKEGTYTIDIRLFMNPDNPVLVDSYDGALATVVAEELPEPPEEEEPEEPVGKINWVPIVLIGGGLAVAAASLIPPKK